jgi:hypothetical protein
MMDAFIYGIAVGALVMLAMSLIAIRLTSRGFSPVSEKLARNKAGGIDFDYTPDRSKH